MRIRAGDYLAESSVEPLPGETLPFSCLMLRLAVSRAPPHVSSLGSMTVYYDLQVLAFIRFALWYMHQRQSLSHPEGV